MNYKTIALTVSILFTLFISMFALDVFQEGYSGIELVIAITMHLLPSLILIGVTLLAWKRPEIGGIVYVLLGIGMTFFFKTYQDLVTVLLITTPPIAIGILFYKSSKK